MGRRRHLASAATLAMRWVVVLHPITHLRNDKTAILGYNMQVRAAYRKKGWALSATDHVEQCHHDEYLDSITEEKGEGCKMWGRLEVSG